MVSLDPPGLARSAITHGGLAEVSEGEASLML